MAVRVANGNAAERSQNGKYEDNEKRKVLQPSQLQAANQKEENDSRRGNKQQPEQEQ